MFRTAADYAAFETVLQAGLERSYVRLYAYCLMPNHWHLVASPERDGELSRFMHWISMTHARRWQIARGLSGYGAVYQGRFKAIPVCADSHFVRVCRYVERNALRAALVQRAEDWRWSSLSRPCENCSPPSLTAWPIPRPDNWLGLVNAPQARAELAAIRTAVKRGMPFGGASWRESLQPEDRLAHRRRPGRPRRTVLEK